MQRQRESASTYCLIEALQEVNGQQYRQDYEVDLAQDSLVLLRSDDDTLIGGKQLCSFVFATDCGCWLME